MRFSGKLGVLLGLLVIALIAVAGCGGGGSSSSSSSTASSESSAGAEEEGSASNAADEESAGGAADLATAEEGIKPYVGKASPGFPVDEPLKEAPSPSMKISQLQFGTPQGAIIAEFWKQAADTAGVQIMTTKGGSTASSIQSAAQTMISQSPDAVLLPAAEPDTFAPQLEEMVDQGIDIYSSGIMDPQKYHFTGSVFDERQTKLIGELLADWVLVKRGPQAKVAFYGTPELAFSGVEEEAFEAQLGKICPECEVRGVAIKAEEIGSTAPNTVVSDLQAHPDTEQAVFASQEADDGLPAALKAAGIEVGIVGFAADPATLEYIKNGEVEATLDVDGPVQIWTPMDMALRTAQGLPLTKGEKAGIMPMQFLTQKDITFDPSKGWTAYPDFVERFSKLWKVGP
ncbi:MAG: substrate-binding domain-containing protein [Actinobacteria bacterium]|nr:substrate-binding domain-containing protein [Actinomycetota bacterium]